MATGDKSHAQTVETGVDTALPEEVIDSPVLLRTQFASRGCSPRLQSFKQRSQPGVNRDSKKLPLVSFLPLSITKPDGASGKVDVLKRNGALRKSAPRIKADFKDRSHPFRLVDQASSQNLNIGVGQLGLNLLCVPSDPEPQKWIGLAELALHRLIQKLGKKFQFKERGVVFDLSSMNGSCYAPAEIGVAVAVLDLARVYDAFGCEEEFNGLPRHAVTPLGTLILPVSSDVARNPNGKCGIVASRLQLSLFNACLVSLSLRLSRFLRIIRAEASRFLTPLARIQIAGPQEPVRGTFVAAQVCHSVRHAVPRKKWNKVYSHGSSMGKCGISVNRIRLEAATITPQGTLVASWDRLSLSRVSHFEAQTTLYRYPLSARREVEPAFAFSDNSDSTDFKSRAEVSSTL